jgi:hypothetical protein
MSDFTFIKIEVYNVAWVDITHDVKSNPGPKWNRGIMSNKPQERIGYPGILTFTLNNSAFNSAGISGYYSPGHASCWSGWTTGLPVRLSFEFEGEIYYKYYGRIKPDGIVVEPGIYGARTTSVTCGDWMWIAAQHELKTMTFAQNKKAGDVVSLVNDNMPFHPLVESIAVGVETFPTIFDMVTSRTTALAEYNKAAMSEWCYIYVKGDKTGGETLVVENQNTRTSSVAVPMLSIPKSECGFLKLESGSYLLLESGGKIVRNETQFAIFSGTMSDGMSVGYGRTQANRVSSTAYPRRVDAAATTVLWALQKSFRIKDGETITGYRGLYRDPNNPTTRVSGISMAAMVSGTDYTATANEDGTGANLTANLTVTPAFGTGEVIFTLSATAELWVQILQVKGKGVYTDTPIQSIKDDATSQATHGVIPISLDFKYQSDANKVNQYAAYVIAKDANPRNSIDACPMWANRDGLNMKGFLELEPGSKANFSETQTGISGDYFIMGYSAEIVNGKHVIWSPILKDDPGFFVFGQWDSGLWDTAVWAD